MKTFRYFPWVNFASLSHATKLSKEQRDRRKEENAQLRAVQAAAVRILEAAGIRCHRPGDNRVWILHELTKTLVEVEQWRNVNLLPAVQTKKRRADATTLAAYCARYTWGLRMRLITSGVRCRVEEVGACIDFLHETVRRLPERKWFASVAELISVGIEFTAEPGPDGHLIYHVHAHLIYRLLRPVSKPKFRAFLQRWRRHFKGRHCPDSGCIRNLMEACKYPCKAADLLGILRAGELPQLYVQLEGRKLFQTYGGLRLLRSDLRRTGEKIKCRRLTAPDPNAVTSPQDPLLEFVRVGAQPKTHVRYGKRRYPDERPTNIHLGRTTPFPDEKNGILSVGSLWLNVTVPVDELLKMRDYTLWSPPIPPSLAEGHDEPTLPVHTYTSSARLTPPLELPPDDGESSPFTELYGPDPDEFLLPDEPDFSPEDLGIPLLEVEPADLQNRYI